MLPQAEALVVHLHWQHGSSGSAFADVVAAASGSGGGVTPTAAARPLPLLRAMLEVHPLCARSLAKSSRHTASLPGCHHCRAVAIAAPTCNEQPISEASFAANLYFCCGPCCLL